MKFSFKRFLSSALAAVMTASVLSVGMVSSVSAATALSTTAPTPVENALYTVSAGEDGAVTYTYDFTKCKTDLVSNASGKNIVFEDGKITQAGDSKNLSYDGYLYGLTGYVQTTKNDGVKIPGDKYVISFTIANGCQADVEITGKTANGSTHRFFICDSTDSNKEPLEADVSDTSMKLTKLGAKTYDIHRHDGDGNGEIEKIIIKVYEANYTNGKVKWENKTPDLGSVSVTKDGAPVPNDDSEITGGSEITINATPPDGYYTKITINGKTTSTDNTEPYTTKVTVDGDIIISVEFKLLILQSDIESSILWDYSDAKTDSLVLNDGSEAENDYYFTLAPETSIVNDENGKRIAVGGTNNGSSKAVHFKTGNLEGKTAKLYITYASGGDEARNLQLGTISADNRASVSQIGTTPATKFTYIMADAQTLSPNTHYFISSKSSTICLSKIVITVADNDTSAVPVATAVTDGKYVFAGITEDAAADFDSLEIYASSTATEAADIIGANNLVGKTATVYGSVEEVTTPTDLNGKKVYAVEVTNKGETAKDFHFAAIVRSATNGDKISAAVQANIPQTAAN